MSRQGRGGRALFALFVYNEGKRLAQTLARFPVDLPADQDFDILLVDDGSDDGFTDSLPEHIAVLRNERNLGLGASIKRAFRYALEHDYDVIGIMAGNGKDDPAEIPRLLAPLKDPDVDFVQGSRFLPGGAHTNMPFHRVVATKIVHPLLFALMARQRVTETTNGFRAFRTTILGDPRLDWEQDWLDLYELEQYVQFKAAELGYRRVEVPVSKSYPPRGEAYTKVKPLSGWWSMIKPIVYLGLKVRR